MSRERHPGDSSSDEDKMDADGDSNSMKTSAKSEDDSAIDYSLDGRAACMAVNHANATANGDSKATAATKGPVTHKRPTSKCDKVVRGGSCDLGASCDVTDESDLTPMALDLSMRSADADEQTADASFARRDDSGIDVGKSPFKDSLLMDAEEGRSARESPPGGGNIASGKLNDTFDLDDETQSDQVTEQPSVSNESEGVGAETSNANAAGSGGSEAGISASSSGDDEDPDVNVQNGHVDTDDELSRVHRRHRNKRRRSRSGSSSRSWSSSNSSHGNSSTDTNDGDAPEKKASSDSDMETGSDAPLRKDTWRPLHEIQRREMGFGNASQGLSLLQQRCGGSISLVQRLRLNMRLESHQGCVNALHFNERGTLLASGSDDLNIVVWDWSKRAAFFEFDSGHRSNVFQCRFMPFTGDTHIVSCARDGQVRLAELSSTGTCKATRKLGQHKGAAHKLALLHDSSHVFYSCGEDAMCYEMDLREDKPNKLCTAKEGDRKVALYSIHANPFKSFEYCVGGRDAFIRIYDKRMINEGVNGGLLKKYCPQHLLGSNAKANVTCAVYSYNGGEVIGSYNDEDIYLFDTSHSDGANFTHRYKGHRNNATVKGVNFYGPRSEFIVSGSDCGNIFFWERESEKIVNYFHGDDGGVVNVLEPHPHYPYLATSGLDHDVKIWLPTAWEPTKLDGLKRAIRKNRKDRDEERQDISEMMDGHMFWLLMQHFRRTQRRRARQDGEEVSTSSDDSDHDSDGDDDEEVEQPEQCATS